MKSGPEGRSCAFYALSAACLFSISIPLGKTLLNDLKPLELSALFYLGGGLGLLAYKLLPGRRSGPAETPIGKEDLPYIAGFTAAGGVIAPALLFAGLSLAPSSSASLLLNSELLFTALIAVVLFGESGGRMFWASAFLVAAGGAALALDPGGLGFRPGLALVALSSFMWAVDNNLTARVSGKDPVTLGVIKNLAGGCVSACLAVSAGGVLPSAGPLLLSLFLGAVSYGASLALLIRSMRGLGAARAGAFFGVYPFMGALFSLLWLGEKAGGGFVASFCLMSAAAFMLSRERHSHYHRHAELEHEHFHMHDASHGHSHPADGGAYGGHSHAHVHAEEAHAHEHLHDTHHEHGHRRGSA